MTHPKRLIEVAFPLREVGAESAREKAGPPGAISRLHREGQRFEPSIAHQAFLAASGDQRCPQRADDLRVLGHCQLNA